jgi:hypothetical protein
MQTHSGIMCSCSSKTLSNSSIKKLTSVCNISSPFPVRVSHLKFYNLQIFAGLWEGYYKISLCAMFALKTPLMLSPTCMRYLNKTPALERACLKAI